MMNMNSVFEADDGKTPEQLCAERTKCILDATLLKQPDHVPIILRLGYLLSELAGTTRQELYENPQKMKDALVSAGQYFQPDAVAAFGGNPGASRILADRSTRWPGFGLGPNGAFQTIEIEFMKAEDYDHFIEDPADWGIRKYLPRVFGELEGLSLLPPLGLFTFGYYSMMQNLPTFANEALVKSFQALARAAQSQVQANANHKMITDGVQAAGFAPFQFTGPLIEAPFDYMTDTLRTMKGTFADMRRLPDKLLAAEEKVSRFMMEHALKFTRSAVEAGQRAYTSFPLHYGSDEWMSLAQFERFYWPQLKSMILKLVENNVTPIIFYEGNWDKRLKYLAELPKGKTIGMFQSSDIFKVKEVLGDTMCIFGGMKVSMLMGWTVEEIRERTKKVCEEVGKGGGFIMTTDIGELEGCNPEMVKAWVDATKEFGAY
jgi:hypothetical protein